MVVIKEGGLDANAAATRLDKLHRTLDRERDRRDLLARTYLRDRDIRDSQMSDRDTRGSHLGSHVGEVRRQEEDELMLQRHELFASQPHSSPLPQDANDQQGLQGWDSMHDHDFKQDEDNEEFVRGRDQMNKSPSSSTYAPADTDPTAYCLLDMDVYPRLHGYICVYVLYACIYTHGHTHTHTHTLSLSLSLSLRWLLMASNEASQSRPASENSGLNRNGSENLASGSKRTHSVVREHIL
jgi:hypothetical protein